MNETGLCLVAGCGELGYLACFDSGCVYGESHIQTYVCPTHRHIKNRDGYYVLNACFGALVPTA